MLKTFEDLLKLSKKMLGETLESFFKNPYLFTQDEIIAIAAFIALADD